MDKLDHKKIVDCISNILEKEYDLHLTNDARRCDGENGRDWYSKFNWAILEDEKVILESEWPGFDEKEELLINLVNSSKKLK